jgi:hypothetical protein
MFDAQDVEAYEEKTQDENAAIMLRQTKARDPPSQQCIRTCFYYGKLGYIM